MVALRAAHMHELAVLNGTLRDIDMKCLNCGREGHKSWQCPESENVTARSVRDKFFCNFLDPSCFDHCCGNPDLDSIGVQVGAGESDPE
jgi:hypothetical protein